MSVCLIVESADISQLEKEVLPKLEIPVCVVRWPQDSDYLAQFDEWIIWLPDASLRALLPYATRLSSLIHLLPHDQGIHSRRGYCLPGKLGQFEWSLEKRSTVEVDVLLCNEQIVLNKVVAGKAFSFQPGGHSHNAWQRLKTVWHQLSHLKDYQPLPFQLSTANEGKLETAAVGVMCAPHVLKSNLSKQLLSENYANDGLFYSLIVAPKSVLQMLRFIVVEPFVRNITQPGFLGVLRSQGLTIESVDEFEYRVDECVQKANKLKLQVEENALRISVESGSLLLESGARHKEIRRVKNLPTAKESVMALVRKPLPWITHAATEDFRELYQQLRENAQISSAFLILMVLSTLLASLGLYADSAPVIIGAMILAPLMSPIVSLAMAFARQDEKLLMASLKTLGIGWFLAIAFAMGLSFLLPLQIETGEIAARLRPTLLDLGVAIISGIASAYAYARAQAAKGLAGVAIAVALVPPLAVTGIGLGWLSAEVAGGALLLFLTNLAGIVFSASATFLLLGYSPFSRARKGLVIALLAVVLVSIPLAFSFNQLLKEGAIVSALEDHSFENITIRQVQVLSTKEPVNISLELVTKLNPSEIDVLIIKHKIEEEIGANVLLEVKWVVQY